MLVRDVFPLKPLVILPLFFRAVNSLVFLEERGIPGSFAWGNLSMMS